LPEQSAKRKAEAVERVFQALAHAARRQMLMTIHFRGGELSAGDIAARFGHTWATTTGHLNALVEAGLLSRSHDGRRRLYRIDRTMLSLASEWLRWFDGDAAEQTRAAVATTYAKPLRRSVRRA